MIWPINHTVKLGKTCRLSLCYIKYIWNCFELPRAPLVVKLCTILAIKDRQREGWGGGRGQ
jgi:hypothetical protein